MVKRISFFVLALLVAVLGMNAQVTSSGMTGVVVDNNETLIGATINAVHVPSGTKYVAVSNNYGRYTIQGMRPGGPYTVTVSYVGYNDAKFENITIQLGSPFELNVTMGASSQMLDEVVVTGTAVPQHAGAAHNFTAQKIESSATVDRNIFDVVKNMPLANYTKSGGMSFAGSSFRYNSFQIDGTTNNDVFGLAFNGTNGGQAAANPISMDAIQEIQVVVAPFDVRQSGFTGGGINAVTKQGTNTFHATYFTYYNNQSFYGKYNAADNYVKSPLSKQHKTTIGGNISGPIVKDKLFFFVNLEHQSKSYPSSYYPGSSMNYLSEETARILTDRYFQLTGIQENWGPRNIDTKSFEILARLDWNINHNNKLALRYQHGDSWDDGYSAGYTSYYFNNSSYRFSNLTNSFVAELNSNIGTSFHNELRASFNRVRDHRDVPYQGPLFWIKNLPNAYDPTDTENYRSNISVNLGTHYVSGANKLDQDIFLLEDNLSWYKDNHMFTFGTHNELFFMKNLFVQYSTGEWVYNSLDAFINNQPSNFYFRCIDPARTGGDLLWAPTIKAGQFGVYAQDKWEMTRNFELTYGIRLDIPVMFNKPTENPEMNAYYESKHINVKIGQMPSTKLMVSPRLGFRWFTDDAHNTLIRGGIGVFTGRVPFVWLSNAFGNNGVEQIGTSISSAADIPEVTADTHQLVESLNKGSKFRMDIATVDKKFRFPQVMRANLALEQKFAGWKFTLEGLYTKTFNQVFFNNLAINQAGATFAVEGVAASQAPFYITDNKCANLINLENTNKGYSYSVSGTIEKNFDFGLNLLASYTFGHSKSVFDGTASIALSSWKASQAVDTRHPQLTYSNFDQPHRILLTVGYTTPRYLNGWLQTNIAVSYNGYSGQRYSLCMNESPSSGYNGDGTRGNSLLYIPTQDELARMDFADITARVNGETVVTMSADEQRAKFEDFIVNDAYAKNHRGQYAHRNSNLAPFEHQIDLHFSESIYCLKERGSKILLTFDVLNFANMLNKKWGASWGNSNSVTPLNNTALINKGNGNYVARYTWNGYTEPSKSDIGSRWHAQIGIKLIF